MSMKFKILACGQGATKSIARALKEGLFDSDDLIIVNSTTKDIPAKLADINSYIISSNTDSGCGKVRNAAKKLMVEYIKENEDKIQEDLAGTDCAILLATSEGASGSGSSIVLSSYIRSLDIPVIVILISGFESDVRGLQNTISYFKDLKDTDCGIICVSNKKFLEDTSNMFKAEGLANDYITDILGTLTLNGIYDSDQNIDNTDHYKIVTECGSMIAVSSPITKKFKNVDQFNKHIADMIDYNKFLEFVPSCKKIGIYLDISEDNLEHLDTEFAVIKNKLCGAGIVPELFIHKQDTGSQFIRIIASGLDLPKEEVMSMYEKYKENSESVNKKDDFFDVVSDMSTNTLNKKKTAGSLFENMSFDDDEDEISSDLIEKMNKPKKSTLVVNNAVVQDSVPKKESKFNTANSKKVNYNEDKLNKL